MIDPAVARRRRAVAALGLGPLWIARGPAFDASDDDDRRSAAIAVMDREALAAEVSRCRACRLGETRLRAVPGDGPDRADWLLVGTAPDADDENSGVAFSGPPGRLLDAMMSAIGVARGTGAFTTHLVKCRPPGDRTPTADEVASCRPFLQRQTTLIAPRLVIALGAHVAEAIGPADAASEWISGGPATERFTVPDPAGLLVAPARKAEAWAALCDIRRRGTPTQ